MTAMLTAIFRIFQHLCPVEFQQAYGASMTRDFADTVRPELRVCGHASALVFAFGAYADICACAAREHY